MAKANPNTLTAAPFWRRVIALCIDLAIVSALIALNVFLLMLYKSLTGYESLENPLHVRLINLAVFVAYYAAFETSRFQATPGKMLMSLKVVDLAGARVGFLRSCARVLSRTLCIATAAIGYVMAAFTERGRALHDLATATVVVTAK